VVFRAGKRRVTQLEGAEGGVRGKMQERRLLKKTIAKKFLSKAKNQEGRRKGKRRRQRDVKKNGKEGVGGRPIAR